VLLTAVAVILANETRSLIAGEAVSPALMAKIRQLLREDARVEIVNHIGTIHLGPGAILVALTLRFKPDTAIAEVSDAIRDLTDAMHIADNRIAYVYARPPTNDGEGSIDRRHSDAPHAVASGVALRGDPLRQRTAD
jgi:divalent metal cation (Fe/Co/Zn/Cd) transporter